MFVGRVGPVDRRSDGERSRRPREFEYIRYETIDDGRIAAITLDRPKQRNAQTRGMLVELGAAFELAEADDTVRVVILRAAGPAFSAGHDLGSADDIRERSPGPDQHPSYRCNGATFGGVESRNRQEWHYYFENTKRWRNLRKITIAQVHGAVLSAGLMLAWCCDLIVASEDTVFADVVGTRLGMCGVEYFGHPWEFGPRKTKELLLTGDCIGADEAHALGMVSKVFPADQHNRIRASDREGADDGGTADQGIGEPNRRCHGVFRRAGRLLQDPPAQSRALGRSHRRQAVLRNGRVRPGGLARRTADPARDQAAALRPGRAVDVSYPPEAEAFRDRIREFVAEHLPPGWPGPGALPPHEREEFARHWRRALAGAGLVAVSWPTEYGGGGLSPMEQVVLAEEFARAGAPERAENDLLGIDLLGNTLIALGSEAQKRHFLPRILSGEHRWCQGFSEPEAGSDLASVRTRGVLDGDEWVINGHKIWTSAGTTANWIFLLARTDPSAAKHRGLSFLLVPMDQPGVVVRPIVNAAGHSSFSEVFLTDARTSAGNVVGRVGDGWSTAMTLLGFERGSHIATAAIDFERDLQRLCELARDRGLHTDPRVRDGLAWCYARVQIMRYRGYRDLTLALTGRPPGAEAAITKVIWSEYFRRYTDLAVEILGLEALGPRGPGNGGARLVPEAGTPNSPACWMDELLYARAATIYAGSSQIQRNVIGERLLGLPKEPRPEVLC